MFGSNTIGQQFFGGSYVPLSYWGVDSVMHADNVRPVYPPGKTFFDLVKDQAVANGGIAQAFWGRYIGSPDDSFNLKPPEAVYLARKGCRILLIYNGENSTTVGATDPVVARQNGVNAANKAIARARELTVPEDGTVWIYCDIENTWSPTADFFTGWLETMQPSGYGAGVYGDTAPPPPAVFSGPYCTAYAATAATPRKYLYNTRPQKGCNWTYGVFNPDSPVCNPPTVIHQYGINCNVTGASFRPVSLRAYGALATADQQSSITPAAPATVQPNDVVLTFVQFSGGSLITTITPPAGWTPVLRVDDGTVEGLAIFRAIYQGQGNPIFGAYTLSGVQDITARAYAYKSVNGTTPIDVTPVGQANSTASTTVTAPSITTVTDNALIVGFFCALDGSGGTLTMNSINAPLAERTRDRFVSTVGGKTLVVGVGDQNTAPGSTGTRTATLSSPFTNIGILVALRPGDPERVDLDLANGDGFPGMWLPKFPIFIVWRAGRVFVPGNIRTVFVASVSNDFGETWSVPVNNPPGDNDYSNFDLTSNSYTVVVRGSGVDVYYVAGATPVVPSTRGQIRRVTFSGGVWSSPVTQYAPSIGYVRPLNAFRSATFPKNSLCWRETVSSSSDAGNVMYADINASTGDFVGTPVMLASNTVAISDPIGSYDSSGNPVVSWIEWTGTAWQGKKRTRLGGVWQTATNFIYTDPNDFDAQRFLNAPSGRNFTAELTSAALSSTFRAIAKANLTDTDLTFVFRKRPGNPDVSVNLRTVTEPPDPTLAVSMYLIFYEMALWEMGDVVLWTFFTTRSTGGPGSMDLWAVLGKADGTDWHVKHVAQEGVPPNTGPDVWGIKPIDFGVAKLS